MFLAGSKACQMLLDDIESTNSIRVLTILISLPSRAFSKQKVLFPICFGPANFKFTSGLEKE